MAAQEQEQHAAAAGIVGAQPRIAINAVEPEHLLVERTGALERVDVERGFQNAEKSGHCELSIRHSGAGTARNPESISATWDYGFRTCRFAALRNDPHPETGTISRAGACTSRLTALAATTVCCCA